MPKLIRNGRVEDDAWVVMREAASLEDLPAGVPAIVPLALWLASQDALLGRADVGVWLAPADDPVAVAHAVTQLPVIAVDFPSFADGRGYSTARLLRERHGYRGELRAIGDIQRDQLAYLVQVGFDAFELAHGRDPVAALASLRDFTDGYQVTNLRAPWFRRRAAAPEADAAATRGHGDAAAATAGAAA